MYFYQQIPGILIKVFIEKFYNKEKEYLENRITLEVNNFKKG